MKWSVQESFVDAVRFRPGHDEYTPLGSGWTAEFEIGAVQRTLLFPELDGALLFILGVDSTALTFNKICHHSCKRAFIPLSNFLPLWFLYILCCWDTVTFVRIIKCVTLSSSQCFRFHYKWYSSHIERLACSALNPHPSLPIVMNWRDHFILIAFSGW